MFHRRSLLAAPALLAFKPLAAQGVWNPQRPIRILVGFAPGGGTDITTRTLTNRLQALLGQPIIVENRPVPAAIWRLKQQSIRHRMATL